MWNVEDLEAVPVELDFSSSGQGRRSATAIETTGVRLFNAIELIDVEATATQVEVCECCGFSHCSHGGWVAFRRIGDRVVWIPAWDRMETGSWEQAEYRPPSFLANKGAPANRPMPPVMSRSPRCGRRRGVAVGVPFPVKSADSVSPLAAVNS